MPTLPVTTPFSQECASGLFRALSEAVLVSVTSGTQVAHYYPWLVESPTTIVKGFTMNGTATNGNVDIGVYDHEFNLVVSIGATAQSGANTLQEYDITDTTLMPGRYWMAMVCSGTGAFFGAGISDEIMIGLGLGLSQASLSALPSTATPIKDTATTVIFPLFGFSTNTVI